MDEAVDYVRRAQKSQRSEFIATCPRFFLVSADALQLTQGPATVEMSPVRENLVIGGVASASPINVYALVKTQAENPDRITVGRLPTNDVCIPDVTLSKLHAYFVDGAGGMALYDAKSQNGTYVGPTRVKALESLPVPIGSTVRFGLVTLTLLDAGQVWERVRDRIRGRKMT